MIAKEKMIIYQVFTRLFGNQTTKPIINGTIEENGCGKMNAFTKKALDEIKKLGATHIWYTGIIAHATQTDYTEYGLPKDHPAVVKGKAGSPYAIKDYYDVDPDLAENVDKRMEEFEDLVSRTHQSGLKVIIDFVPNHVARQYHSVAKLKGIKDLGEDDDVNQAFSPNNNFYYIPGQKLQGNVNLYDEEAGDYIEMPAKATGNNRFDAWPEVNDWYETVKLNYGVDYISNTGCHFSPIPSTWRKMCDILLFWASKGVDGFRCDMAEMVPCEFWGWAIPRVKKYFRKIIFIAEVYNPNEYRNYIFNGHFDYLYDKVGLYDTLRAVICGNAPATSITNCWQSVNDIQSHMLNFLENHDEQRIASEFFAGNAKRAFPAMIVSTCMYTNPMMIYFGQELGEPGMEHEGFSGRDGRTTIFDYWCVDSIRRWENEGNFTQKELTTNEKTTRLFYKKLLNLCNSEPVLKFGEFFDLMYANHDNWQMDESKQYAFLRKYKYDVLLFVVNFGDFPMKVSVNLPKHAFEYLKMSCLDSCKATDLLSKETEVISFNYNEPTTVNLAANSGKILKIKLKKIK